MFFYKATDGEIRLAIRDSGFWHKNKTKMVSFGPAKREKMTRLLMIIQYRGYSKILGTRKFLFVIFCYISSQYTQYRTKQIILMGPEKIVFHCMKENECQNKILKLQEFIVVVVVVVELLTVQKKTRSQLAYALYRSIKLRLKMLC